MHGDIWHVNLRASRMAQQTIALHPGWNLVSTRLEATDRSIDNVLRTALGSIVRVLSLDCEDGALSYYPDLPPGLNSLREIDARHGYWVDANGHILLVVSGVEVPADMPLPLCSGFNQVSYLPSTALPVAEALQSIAGSFDAVFGFDSTLGALSYYADLPPALNSLHQLEPGHGYWLKMKEPATLVYPGP